MKIAYLGPAGTYSEAAALEYGGAGADYIPTGSVEEATGLVDAGMADVAVVAVENSTEGPVSSTLDLLAATSLQICAEVLLPIHHQLLSKSHNTGDIKRVIAHPQALGQCRKWLKQHLPNAEQVASVSNAQAAADAASDSSLGAIASQRAADLYDLSVLGTDIEDVTGNTTRFLALGNKRTHPTGRDKTSLVCSVPNRSGALYELLGILAKYKLNMTKLESRPSFDVAWDYIFFIDIEGHRDDEQVTNALAEADALATFLKVIGSYPLA